MAPEATLNVMREALTILFAVSLPLLLVGLAVGVAISLVQAATQVQEASMVFVPKLLAIAATFWVTAPWASEKLVTFCRQVFEHIGQVGLGGGF